jgi:hypothetical protein
VIILHRGYAVYSGPVRQCAAYFESRVPDAVAAKSFGNDAEYCVHVVSALPLHGAGPTDCSQSILELARLAIVDVSAEITSAEESLTVEAPSWWSVLERIGTRLVILLKREWLKEYRRRRYWLACLIRLCALGSMLGKPFQTISPLFNSSPPSPCPCPCPCLCSHRDRVL